MYKLLLCWRYLRTRYIALICIVSIMLGVATLIVTNAVMAGFSEEMQVRMKGMMGDVIIEARSMNGAFDADSKIKRIKSLLGDSLAGVTPTVRVPAILSTETEQGSVTQQIMLVGIDEQTYCDVSIFGEYLQHPENREQLSFGLKSGGYDTYDHATSDSTEPKLRKDMEDAGWNRRRKYAAFKKQQERYRKLQNQAPANAGDPFADAARANGEAEGTDFDPATEQHVGIVLGFGLASWRDSNGMDHFRTLPGLDVAVSFPNAALPPKAISENYTVVDLYESGLGEFDANIAFVPLKDLQLSRGLVDPTTGVARFNAIMLKLNDEADAIEVRDQLRDEFSSQLFRVSTWRDQQNSLLQAIQMETVLLNILLFMIIAVAGFGIFAIFLMIVVEKTRDIGILKSLGASSGGVMGIFLSYGLALGLVGATAGLGLGILLERNINTVKDWVSWITGQPIFDPSVYFFNEIPTLINPLAVTWICLGAITIAVLSSVFPAWRASRLHPVRALRYE